MWVQLRRALTVYGVASRTGTSAAQARSPLRSGRRFGTSASGAAARTSSAAVMSSVSAYSTTVALVTPNQLSPSVVSTGFGARAMQTSTPTAITAPAASRWRTASAAGVWLRTTAQRSTGTGASARACVSTRSRTRSSSALSTVNTTAVIQAVCTSGSANPSTTTAT